MPEIDGMFPNYGANTYLALYDDEEAWNGAVLDGDWFEFEAVISQLNKEVAEDAAADEDWSRTAESTFDLSAAGDLKDMTE